MKFTGFIMLAFCFQTVNAQIKLSRLTVSAIPQAIHYKGILKNASTWHDSGGQHIVLTTETGETRSKMETDDNDSYRDAALYAYHYLTSGDSAKLTWKLYDFIKECPVDISAGFIKNTFAVTDLNKDGTAEVWLMYKTVCHGDVSPSDMKIIMYEGEKKYAVRGTNKVKVSEKEYMGGEYSFDDAFKKAPKEFSQYATTLWEKNILEKWD